jgi:hypothetical protein
MTIPFENIKARLLANPEVKAEYDALAPEFEISAELIKAVCAPDYRRPRSPSAWAPANPPSPGWKAGRRCQAPRLSCATPRRLAAGSTSAYRRLECAISRSARHARALWRDTTVRLRRGLNRNAKLALPVATRLRATPNSMPGGGVGGPDPR